MAREDQTTVDRFVRFAEPALDLEDVCLEIGSGPAEVSRAIARRVRHATALDASTERLAAGKLQADRDAIMNLTFVRGNAAELPYVARTFTLVLVRNALGDLPDPAAVVGELVRVSRPGAAIIIEDEVLGQAGIVALLELAGAEVKRLSGPLVAAAAP
ncbi:MAG: class I SAM-dependent methyltransferase [Streptosporangiaceae bacterium]